MWNLKEFEIIYDRYQSSGLRVKDFCHNECIQEPKFYYWQKKLKHQHHLPEQPARFVPLLFKPSDSRMNNRIAPLDPIAPASSSLHSPGIYEIIYPNGVRVRVPAGTDTKQLEYLILLSR